MGIEGFHVSSSRPADGIVVIQVSGEIDITSSLAFKERLFGELDEGATQVVLDLDACSEGWVRRALANTGLDQMIATHATLDGALGCRGPAL